MPKLHRNLYIKLLDFQRMHEAWLKAKKGKRFKHDVLVFERDLEVELLSLIDDLRTGNYRTGNYKSFYIHEPKKREVSCLESFRDRVLQHAVCSILEPIFEGVFISDSYACRAGKGTHAGVDRVQRMIRKVKREHGVAHALKCDVRKYFANIDHDILIGIIAKKIGDQSMLDLLENIIRSFGENGKGLPLGNLTSQLFANIYLNELDQLVKRDFRESEYIRYMDDFVIIHQSKNHLHMRRRAIEKWLKENLKLELNNKTAVFKVARTKGRALDFLGYRILPNNRRLRRGAVKALTRKMNLLHSRYSNGKIGFTEIKQALASHIAHANHAESNALLIRIFNKPFKREINNVKDLHCI